MNVYCVLTRCARHSPNIANIAVDRQRQSVFPLHWGQWNFLLHWIQWGNKRTGKYLSSSLPALLNMTKVLGETRQTECLVQKRDWLKKGYLRKRNVIVRIQSDESGAKAGVDAPLPHPPSQCCLQKRTGFTVLGNEGEPAWQLL